MNRKKIELGPCKSMAGRGPPAGLDLSPQARFFHEPFRLESQGSGAQTAYCLKSHAANENAYHPLGGRTRVRLCPARRGLGLGQRNLGWPPHHPGVGRRAKTGSAPSRALNCENV